ncbi:Pycsar system effector family protein [Saccharopolyspora sp. NPDC002376]
MVEYVPASSQADRIAQNKTSVVEELKRADTKAQILLGLIVGTLAGIVGLTRTGVSTAAEVLLVLAAIPAAAAVVFLALTIRPFLGGAQAGFVRWAHFVGEPEALLADLERPAQLETGHAAAELAKLSRLAVNKYERIAYAVYLFLLALAVALLALFLA